ncbi:hypothetical protein, partial [Burkholderia ubonensis]|uniref:hypothetical protein n=1 Tax=Burkholderia ubonensis TaxID=101571 RepID=UPI0015A66318
MPNAVAAPPNVTSPPPAPPFAVTPRLPLTACTVPSPALFPPVTLTLAPCSEPVSAMSRVASTVAACANAAEPAPLISRAAFSAPSIWPASAPVNAMSRPACTPTCFVTEILPPSCVSSPDALLNAPAVVAEPVNATLPFVAVVVRSPFDSTPPL